MSAVEALVPALQQARLACAPLIPLPVEQVDVAQGYDLQRAGLHLRQSVGERLSGWKVAFASAAAQQRFGLQEPVYGGLTDAMALVPGAELALATLIQPKLEIEAAFVLGQDLLAGSYSDEQLLAAVFGVAPAFEIADSRWQQWRFGAGAFIGDNAAAARYCLGMVNEFDGAGAFAFALHHDEVLLEQGTTEGRAEQPLGNLLWLLRRVLADGQPLRAGQVILSGALLAPLDIVPGQYHFTLGDTALSLAFLPSAS